MNMIQSLPSYNKHPDWGDRQTRMMISCAKCNDRDLYQIVIMLVSLPVLSSMNAPRYFKDNGSLSIPKGFQKGAALVGMTHNLPQKWIPILNVLH